MVEESEYRNVGYPAERRQPGEISMSGVASTVTDFPATPTTDHPKMDNEVVLSTKRLTLRAPHGRDMDMLVTLANNPKVATNLGTMPHPYSAEDGRHWIEVLSRPVPRKMTFAITDRYTDVFLGGCGYRPCTNDEGQVDIGYWLGEPHWGQGLAAEAAQALIDHAFKFENVTAVWVSARATNHQSKRVIEKCGFQFAYHGMASSLAVTGMVAIDHYSMNRSTWESLHSWGER